VSEDIESIIARVKRPEQHVPLCLDGDLVAEYERLGVLLEDAVPAVALGDDSSAESIVEQMRVLHEQMVERRAWFRFRALDPKPWSDHKAKLPTKQDGESDEDHDAAYLEWQLQLIASSCYEPVMSTEQAGRFWAALTDVQKAALFGGAWGVNATRGKDIPFSRAASALTPVFAGKSRRRASLGNPVPDSSAASPEPPPSTNTTTTDG
jgi:hypothetical protein